MIVSKKKGEDTWVPLDFFLTQNTNIFWFSRSFIIKQSTTNFLSDKIVHTYLPNIEPQIAVRG
jgi:hypothetical protein